MRTFETLLITANFLTLFLSSKKMAKAIWLGIVWINLLTLLIHGVFEGFRYQMAFSYVFVILLAVYVSAKASGRFSKVKIPKALGVITICLSFALLALTSFLAYALPVFTLPKPTGDYAVGVKYFVLVDENRTDPFLAKSTRKRELMIKVYYPAKRDDSKPFSPYFHASTKLIRAWAAFYQMPPFLFDHFTLVKTYSNRRPETVGQATRIPRGFVLQRSRHDHGS